MANCFLSVSNLRKKWEIQVLFPQWGSPCLLPEFLPSPPGQAHESASEKNQRSGLGHGSRRRIAHPNHKVLVIPIRDGKRQILPRQDITGRVFLEHQQVRGLISIQKILGVPGAQRRLEIKSERPRDIERVGERWRIGTAEQLHPVRWIAALVHSKGVGGRKIRIFEQQGCGGRGKSTPETVIAG